MGKITVYQFEMYHTMHDVMHKSRRWGTREAIDKIHGNLIDGTGVEVDEATLGKDIPGLSDIGYDPHATKGFQRQVRS